MAYKCERCGSCCKLAWAKVRQGFHLPLNEDGSCANLLKKDGKYECVIFETRPDHCRSSFVQKMYNLTEQEYEKKANKARVMLRQIVSQSCG